MGVHQLRAVGGDIHGVFQGVQVRTTPLILQLMPGCKGRLTREPARVFNDTLSHGMPCTQIIGLQPMQLAARIALLPPLRSEGQLAPAFFDAPGARQVCKSV